MNSRQNEVPMRDALYNIDVSFSDQKLVNLLHAMVTIAYDTPLFYTFTSKQEAITEFGNYWHLACTKVKSKH